MEDMMPKVHWLRTQFPTLDIEVDGGVGPDTVQKCAEAGAKAIIVSHHHGRVPYAVPPMMILPEIKKALEGRGVQIFVDCGIASGADVYKALALGADAAAVGRSMLPGLEKEGVPGVKNFIKNVNDELRFIMSSTGFSKVEEINSTALRIQ